MTTPRAPRVLFVCEGNICRSPYAMISFAELWAASSDRPVSSRSAGTRARAGVPAHEFLRPFFVGGSSERLAAHRSERLTADAARSSDVVVTMERAQRTAVLTLAPAALRRTFSLDELARLADAVEAEGGPPHDAGLADLFGRHRLSLGAPEDVADPMGGGPGDFAEMAHTIDAGLRRIVPLLVALDWAERS